MTSPTGFLEKLATAQRSNASLLCVGLDPQPEKIARYGVSLGEFLRAIVEATADQVCAFKPQFAHFAALSAEDELQAIIEYIHTKHPAIPVILDAKRGDIGSTAEKYAAEAFDRYGADAVTVNPYLGGDTLQPFLQRRDKGVIVLCKTSNPGSGEIQNLELADGSRLFQQVARLASKKWNGNQNVMLVVGATWPEELAQVRAIVGDMPLLIPGIGAQGGDLRKTLKYGLTADGTGLVLSASRSVLYAGDAPHNFAPKARLAAEAIRLAAQDIIA